MPLPRILTRALERTVTHVATRVLRWQSKALRSENGAAKLSCLSVAERHGLAMTCIRKVRVKLEIISFQSAWASAVAAARASITTLRDATHEARQSEPLARLLQAILHIGNYCALPINFCIQPAQSHTV